MNLPDSIKKYKYLRDVPLAQRTTLRIGGEAAVWFEPRSFVELAKILKAVGGREEIFLIGAGSNLLFGDGRHEKIFIHLGAPAFAKVKVRGTAVRVGAGLRLGRLISTLMFRDLGGYEFLAGIPGTIGGALVMNAGARSCWEDPSSYAEMKDIIASVDVMDRNGRCMTLKKNDIAFSYRYSSLKRYVLLGAVLKLNPADRKAVTARIKSAMAHRLRAQDWVHPSAGCFFKNPKHAEPASFLIDRCGLKGFRIGGAQVSEKHANFIINAAGARAKDVLKLVEIIREKVYNRFRVKLEPEVQIVL
jgi:UDP-N-acetylmuramate dehydrogenase